MTLETQLKSLLNDPSIVCQEQLQSLWSGYGQIVRCQSMAKQQSYIVKEIIPQAAGTHPRGWNTATSHQRKLQSYQVEANFYQRYAGLVDQHNKIPKLIACCQTNDVNVLVLEDLDAAGYYIRKDAASWHDLTIAIRWLAYFHARFMGCEATELWPIGCYWHLATRQDELSAMPASEYKRYAQQLDDKLNNATFKTLVHGDAKFENLCFHHNGKTVAAVDFQYVGAGSGVKDLAYLVGSCLSQEQLIEFDPLILPEYLNHLQQALAHYQVAVDFNALKAESYQLYPIAWADFYRFLLGWNPQSWKICQFMKAKAALGLSLL